MTKAYAQNTAKALVRDYNAYRRMNYTAACKDYRTALDNLIRVAARQGWKMSYTVTSEGFITLG